MILPLYDSNPKHRIPFQYVTVTLIGICVVVFLWQQTLDPRASREAVLGLGAIPAILFGHADLAPGLAMVPEYATLITSMFMHGGWMHLGGNLLFLWVLGDNIEDSMGHGRFFVFYLLCGLAAAFAHAAIDPQSQTPMIGASGAISGVIGAYLILHPKASIHTLVFSFIVAIPAWIVLGMWLGLQLFNVVSGGGGGVAWWAHIGGAIAGMALIPLFKHSAVPLFDGIRGTGNETDQQPEGSEPNPAPGPRPMPRGITITPVARAAKTPSSPSRKRRRPWH